MWPRGHAATRPRCHEGKLTGILFAAMRLRSHNFKTSKKTVPIIIKKTISICNQFHFILYCLPLNILYILKDLWFLRQQMGNRKRAKIMFLEKDRVLNFDPVKLLSSIHNVFINLFPVFSISFYLSFFLSFFLSFVLYFH